MSNAVLYDLFINTFVMLFAAINPIGAASVFGIMTRGSDKAHKIAMANKAVFTVTAILLGFGLIGETLLVTLGISFEAFKVAGGLLLLLSGIGLVMDSGSEPHVDTSGGNSFKDIAVFPVAIPITAGPAAITSIVLKMQEASGSYTNQAVVMGAMFLVIIIVYTLMRSAEFVERVCGKNIINILSRIIGVLLCSLACEFILKGLAQSQIFSGALQLSN